MAHGIQVFGDSGYAQIDQDYSNFGLLASGSVSVAAPGDMYTSSTFTTISFPDTGVRPLIFVRSPANGAFVQLRELGNTFARFGLVTSNGYYFYTSGVLEYQIYAPVNHILSNDSYGMAIYRPDGQLSFHSGMNSMRIHSIANINTVASSVAISAPSNPFFLVNPSTFVYREWNAGGTEGGGTDYLGSAFKYAGGSLLKADALVFGVWQNAYGYSDVNVPLLVFFLK